MKPTDPDYIPSTVNRIGGNRACLCADNTYSIECCDGSLHAEGVGSVTGDDTNGADGVYRYQVTSCVDAHRRTISSATELTVGNVYYFEFSQGAAGCYTVTQERTVGGNLITSSQGYATCALCIAQYP